MDSDWLCYCGICNLVTCPFTDKRSYPVQRESCRSPFAPVRLVYFQCVISWI